jgi:hypothetical protein
MSRQPKLSRWILLSILVIVPVGFYSKFYAGPAAGWVNNSLGGVFYTLFWCLVAYWFLPNSKPWRIVLLVFTVTCLLEVLQLWHPPFLEWLRSFFLGATLLGTTFAWSDFPYYVVGCGAGWFWLWVLSTRAIRH